MAPVVSAALGALGPLLLKLTALLAGEFGCLKGVRREIRSLRSELTSMHAAVHKYMMLEDPDVQVKSWISLVRELAYDIEDCIDKFIHQLGGSRRQGGFRGFFRETARCLRTLGSRRGIASQIDDLQARVKQVKELKSSYKFDDTACSTSGHGVLDPRLSTLFAEEANLVGVDGPRDDLAKWMIEEDGSNNHHLKVLSIVGFGGLGKTTLAHEICRKIQGNYHCQVFIPVSQKPDIKKIIKDVVYNVPCPDEFIKDIDIWDEVKSIAKMRELLQDKRYLVIVDDIWSTSAWNTIKCAFPENNCSSRIITTTRISDVARLCCSGGDHRIYNMEPLSHIHSRRLFIKRIFGSTDYCPDMLKEISDEILKKCGGLPLAIISISGLLGNKPVDKQEWEKVKRSIGSGLGRNQCLEGMNSILSLSYSVLSSNLKTCLLYLSAFPEDCVIDRRRLVRRWVAEGFITEERGLSLEEVAENNFYELINRNLVQPVDIGYDGKACACRVHDMMLELLISKSIEENFIGVVNGGQTVWENSHGYTRRLSIHHIDEELASVLVNKDLWHVRSLTVTTTGCIKHLPSLVKFEALRVMDFEGSAGLENYDLNGLDKLFQVKYISFRNTGILKLPSGIVKLHHLETLDLRNTYIQELPAGIVQLTKLQHLLTARHFGGGRTKIPDGIGNMRNLRVISGFNITISSVGAVEELGNLTCLVCLCVELNGGGSDRYKRHEEMLLSSLCKLSACKLQSLGIFSNDSTPLEFLDSWSPVPLTLQRFQISTDYHLLNTPKWIAPTLISLAHLCINLVEVTEKDLHMLGKLNALISLELLLKSGQKERVAVQGYPSLKKFSIVCTVEEGGTYITFGQGAMPKLEKLRLPFSVSVAKTYGFYLGIEHLPCLKEAEVTFYHDGAGYLEVKAATAVIRNEAGVHLNHPEVTILGECNEDHRIWRRC